jgi:hypothetical protein
MCTTNNNYRTPSPNSKDYIDPTANVIAMVKSAVKRIDDLQTSHNANDRAEINHLNEKLTIHINYMKELSETESKRLDAIRGVDVGAVAIASERAAATASVLANQVTQSAETLRALVATTAASVATNLAQVSTQLTDRLALLEKKQYENQGKSSVTDPQMEMLNKKMDSLIESRASSTGSGIGRKEMYGWIVGAIMFIIGIAQFLIPLLKA